MIFGIVIWTLGYVLFYWGYHHYTSTRYGFFQLLGAAPLGQGKPFALKAA